MSLPASGTSSPTSPRLPPMKSAPSPSNVRIIGGLAQRREIHSVSHTRHADREEPRNNSNVELTCTLDFLDIPPAQRLGSIICRCEVVFLRTVQYPGADGSIKVTFHPRPASCCRFARCFPGRIVSPRSVALSEKWRALCSSSPKPPPDSEESVVHQP